MRKEFCIHARSAILVSVVLLGAFLVVIPGTVVAYQDGDYTFTVSAGVATITGYTGAGGAITIPSKLSFFFVEYPTVAIGDYAFSACTSLTSVTIPSSVTSIGEHAFDSCTSLTSVKIPNSVTSIGDWAFYHCTSLTSVTIGNGVTSIEYGAFYQCVSLTSVTIPDSVTLIGDSAFEECTSLTSVTIPNSVTSIGVFAFYLCTSLTAIDVDAGNPSYASIDGVLYDKAVTYLFECPGGKAGVLTIPSSVTHIGHYAFYSCTSLTSVTIPKSVTYIGIVAFGYCTSLISITFLGLVAPTAISLGWIHNTNVGIRGHAYAASNFPAPGGVWYGLTMGAVIPLVPGVPQGLSVSPDNAQIVLAWTAPADDGGGTIDYYVVYCDGVDVEHPATTTATITGLSNGQSYSFTVAAHNAAGLGTQTESASSIPFTIPDAPINLAATPSNAQVTLYWTAPAFNGGRTIDYYVVYRNGVDVAHPTATAEMITGLTNGQTYSFNVAAHNAAGLGAQSSAASATPYAVPNAPTGLTATPGNAQVALSWIAPAFDGGRSIDYYLIYVDGSGLPAHPTGVTTVITGLSNGQSYFFMVAAHNLAGTGAQSVAVSTTPHTMPNAPVLGLVTSGSSLATLVWTVPSSDGGSPITGYKLYRSATSDGTYTLIASPTALTYTDTGLTNGQTYWYKVSAVNAVGEGAQSSAVSVSPTNDNTTLILVAVIAIGLVLVTVSFILRKRRSKK